MILGCAHTIAVISHHGRSLLSARRRLLITGTGTTAPLQEYLSVPGTVVVSFISCFSTFLTKHNYSHLAMVTD